MFEENCKIIELDLCNQKVLGPEDPWEFIYSAENLDRAAGATMFIVLEETKETILREGYTMKFFFQSISWNTNLTSISLCIFTLNLNWTVFYAFMKHFSERNF